MFDAVRRFLAASDEAGLPLSEAMAKVSSPVMASTSTRSRSRSRASPIYSR